jgi:hypothetical protein
MPSPFFQIININLQARPLFRRPIVCDISPFPVQVVNVAGISEENLIESVRALTAWDMKNSISQKEIAGRK